MIQGVPALLLLLHATLFSLISDGAVSAGQASISPSWPRITVAAPEPMEVELALDEVEIAWRGDRAVVSLHDVRNAAELVKAAKALKAANLDADVHLVVYAPGPHRSPATRRLLNQEVRLRMQPGAIPQRALVGLALAPRSNACDRCLDIPHGRGSLFHHRARWTPPTSQLRPSGPGPGSAQATSAGVPERR